MATQVSLNSGAVSSAGSLKLQTNGTTDAVTIDTSQNMGLGVTPSAWNAANKVIEFLNSTGTSSISSGSAYFNFGNNNYYNGTSYIYKGTGYATNYQQTPTGTHVWQIAGSGTAGNAITWTQAMTLDASGNLLVNTTTAREKITVNGSIAASGQLIPYSGSTSLGYIGNDSSIGGGSGSNIGLRSEAAMLFATGGSTERARIDTSGNLLVGSNNASSYATTAGIYLYGQSPGYLLNNTTSTGGVSLALFYSSFSVANQAKFEVTSEGNVKSRTNSYAGFSDERLKQNITPASSQWNDIKAYDVVKFQMKSEQFSDEENPWMLGVVAQQVEQISPGLVDEDAKDGMKTVKYSILYMKAVKALQEAMARIEQLEADVAALKG